MSLSGMCVALSAALFPFTTKTVVLSILGTYLMKLFWIILFLIIISNAKISSLQRRRTSGIYSSWAAQRCITIYEAYGAYNMQKRKEIITIVDKTEYQKLMNFINKLDPKAFITVYNVSNMRYQPKCKSSAAPQSQKCCGIFNIIISIENVSWITPWSKNSGAAEEKKSERMQMDTINDIVIVQIRTLFRQSVFFLPYKVIYN